MSRLPVIHSHRCYHYNTNTIEVLKHPTTSVVLCQELILELLQICLGLGC